MRGTLEPPRGAEVRHCTSFGGEWQTGPDEEAVLVRQGWRMPWAPGIVTWMREAPLVEAPVIALAVVRAPQGLGCQVADLAVKLDREEAGE